MRRLLLLPLLSILSGCHGASLATQWKLRDFSIASADLTQLRIAARGPEWMTITPEKAAIETTIRAGANEREIGAAVLHLQTAAHPSDKLELARFGGGAPTAIELDAQSLAAARELQHEARRLKAEGVRVRGNLHLDGSFACRRDRALPPGAIPTEIYVHVNDELGWLPLYADFDARLDETNPEKLEQSIPRCPEAHKPG
jgi:hypothetical protein